MTTNLRSTLFPVALGAASLVLAGCSSVEVGGVGDGPAFFRVFLQVPEGQSAVVGSGQPLSVTVGDGGTTLTVVTAEFVWEDIEFARSPDPCADSQTADDGDDCSEVAIQPTVLNLQLESSPQVIGLFQAPVEPGTYERLQFTLHPVGGTEANLLSQGFQEGTSVRVVGNIDADDGTTQIDALLGPSGVVNVPFNQQIELEEGQAAEITLIVNVDSWFRAEDGSVIDPDDADDGGQLGAEVRENILQSFGINAGG